MKSIAIIYGSSTDNTKIAAQKIAEKLSDYSPTLIDIYHGEEEGFHTHDVLILGISTWGVKDLQDDWADFFYKLEKMDLKNKTIALFGLGDSFIYRDSFVDAIGIMYETLVEKGCKLVGEVSPEGYHFDYSRALKNGVFVGLPLDDDNEADLTDERIANWVESLKEYLV